MSASQFAVGLMIHGWEVKGDGHSTCELNIWVAGKTAIHR